MTNYAFQGVGRTLNLITALAIHLIKCAAKANCRLNLAPQPKGVGLSFLGFYPVSCITLAELEFGVENSSSLYKQKQRQSFEKFSKTFEDRTMAIRPCFSYYAQQKVKLRQTGMMISDFDLLIGCSSVVSDMVMVSENIKELNRIENIKLENWVVRP